MTASAVIIGATVLIVLHSQPVLTSEPVRDFTPAERARARVAVDEYLGLAHRAPDPLALASHLDPVPPATTVATCWPAPVSKEAAEPTVILANPRRGGTGIP